MIVLGWAARTTSTNPRTISICAFQIGLGTFQPLTGVLHLEPPVFKEHDAGAAADAAG